MSAIDALLHEPVQFECFGGFVLHVLYGLPRPTIDVDVLSIAPRNLGKVVLEFAGQGSSLHARWGLYVQYVTVATVPENYEERMTAIFPNAFSHLHLFALDPYDLALSKLERNSQRDRDDVKFLAERVPFDLKVLKERYRKELRCNLGNPEREDLTLKLWVEAIEENRARGKL